MAGENGKSATSNVLFLLAGAAIGAALGVLLAPRSGRETRGQLTDWLRDRREKGNYLLGRIKEKLPVKKQQLAAAFRAGKDAYFDNQPGAQKEDVSA